MISADKAAFRMGVAEHLLMWHGFEYQNLNSREWRVVDAMHTAGRGTAYTCVIIRRINRMRKDRPDGQPILR